MLSALHSTATRLVFGKEALTSKTSFYDTTATAMDGTVRSMREFEGKVVVVVNVASF